MPCPLNGPRNIQEFICAGPVEPHPDPNSCSDHEWTEYVWMEENLAGVVREWWCHVATSYWFIAERDTVRDEILATYPADRIFSERVDFAPPPPPPAAPEQESRPAEAAKPPEPTPAKPPAETPTETPPEPEAPPAPVEAAPDDAPPDVAPADDAPAEDAATAKEAASGDEPEGESAPPRPEGTTA